MRVRITAEVWGLPKDSYGENYRAHVLELYKMYAELVDRLGARRQAANTFFLSINTVLISFLGLSSMRFIGDKASLWLLPVAVAGVTLAYFWYRLVRSYGQITQAMYILIHEIEGELPLKIYSAEWSGVGGDHNSRLYISLTRVEGRVPFVFALLYAILASWTLFATLLVQATQSTGA